MHMLSKPVLRILKGTTKDLLLYSCRFLTLTPMQFNLPGRRQSATFTITHIPPLEFRFRYVREAPQAPPAALSLDILSMSAMILSTSRFCSEVNSGLSVSPSLKHLHTSAASYANPSLFTK